MSDIKQNTKLLGDNAEDLALNFMRGKGYELVEKNFEHRYADGRPRRRAIEQKKFGKIKRRKVRVPYRFQDF